jgi:hypothetical protein
MLYTSGKIKLLDIDQMMLRGIFILDFLSKEDNSTVENFIDPFKKIIYETHSAGNLRGMRLLFKDINERSKALSPLKFGQLEKELRAKFG